MEKIIKIPEAKSSIISPGDVSNTINGTITVWKEDLLIGFVFQEDDYWNLIDGIKLMDSDEELTQLVYRHPKLTFKLNIFE